MITYFVKYSLEITKFLVLHFLLSSLFFQQNILSSVHPFRFLRALINKKGLFIEKNYFEQYTGLVEIGYFTTSDSTISIWHMAGLCRLLLLSLQKVPCVVSWSILLALQEGRISLDTFSSLLRCCAFLSLFDHELVTLFTESKRTKRQLSLEPKNPGTTCL